MYDGMMICTVLSWIHLSQTTTRITRVCLSVSVKSVTQTVTDDQISALIAYNTGPIRSSFINVRRWEKVTTVDVPVYCLTVWTFKLSVFQFNVIQYNFTGRIWRPKTSVKNSWARKILVISPIFRRGKNSVKNSYTVCASDPDQNHNWTVCADETSPQNVRKNASTDSRVISKRTTFCPYPATAIFPLKIPGSVSLSRRPSKSGMFVARHTFHLSEIFHQNSSTTFWVILTNQQRQTHNVLGRGNRLQYECVDRKVRCLMSAV